MDLKLAAAWSPLRRPAFCGCFGVVGSRTEQMNSFFEHSLKMLSDEMKEKEQTIFEIYRGLTCMMKRFGIA